ncbi:hypothetical protein B5F76_10350 [Desulfovibrio sp. An276]|nr:hypothetical protein B5F76_10350 [Desulfovibrio sp. An276]
MGCSGHRNQTSTAAWTSAKRTSSAENDEYNLLAHNRGRETGEHFFNFAYPPEKPVPDKHQSAGKQHPVGYPSACPAFADCLF